MAFVMLVAAWSVLPSHAAAASGGCTFYPSATWNGAIPGGCISNQYLIFTGAMQYGNRGGYCQYDFISLGGGGLMNNCALAAALEQLATNLYNNDSTKYYSISVGPNDCDALFGAPGISAAASALNGTLASVWQNTPYDVTVYAAVDAEGYGYNGDCYQYNDSQFYYTSTFFGDYYGDGGSTPTIRPAGGAPLTPSHENSLSTTGHGLGLPQIYGPGNQYNWPTSIAYGYLGIQTYPDGSPWYSSDCQANTAWTNYTGDPPEYDYDWISRGNAC